MSTSENSSPIEAALTKVPTRFRGKIIQHFSLVKTHLNEGKDESAGLAAGKFCEAVLRLLQQEVHGSCIAFNRGIGNFDNECRKLSSTGSSKVPNSLRVEMPRALTFIYTLRNKRGIGHIGGDVDANRIDAMTIARTCDWIICELIRVYHDLSLEEAQDLVDGLSQRFIPDIWNVAGKKRVLKSGLSFKEKVLLLCYQEPNIAVLSEDIFDWVEHSNFSVFKRDVLLTLHQHRMVEYDKETETITISPLGNKEVEEHILKGGES